MAYNALQMVRDPNQQQKQVKKDCKLVPYMFC